MQITSWENKRVIITGSGGFIGGRLLTYLTEKKAKVLGLTRHPKRARVEKKMDMTDKKALTDAVSSFRPHACFHLAGEALVEAGQLYPYETFHNNIVSTLNILEVCRKLGAPRVIIASTAHVYGDAPQPFREHEPAKPSRPYETSKTCADLIAQSYADSFNLPVLIPRFVNIYGPGDTNTTRIIPKTILAIMRNEQPTLWGGRARRDYLFIDDALSAYDVLGRISDRQIERNRIYNFATGKPVTAKKLIEMILLLMGKPKSIKHITDARPHEIIHQDVAWTKAKTILGWSPTTDLSAGLTATIAWFQTKDARR